MSTITIQTAGASGTWGGISGTLANQTDLDTALGTKAVDASVVHNSGNETVAGVKTLSSVPVAAGLTAPASTGLALASPLGASASDVCVDVGSSVADASVNASAALMRVVTGMAGTRSPRFVIDKNGGYILGGNSGGTTGFRVTDRVGGASYQTTLGVSIVGGSQGVNLAFDWSSGGIWACNDFSRFNGSAIVATITSTGALNQSGTDSSGSPGAATINKPIGISAIATGASSVVITNSLVTTGSHIQITLYGTDATCKEVHVEPPSNGSFTVSGSANATAPLKFAWSVRNML